MIKTFLKNFVWDKHEETIKSGNIGCFVLVTVCLLAYILDIIILMSMHEEIKLFTLGNIILPFVFLTVSFVIVSFINFYIRKQDNKKLNEKFSKLEKQNEDLILDLKNQNANINRQLSDLNSKLVILETKISNNKD